MNPRCKTPIQQFLILLCTHFQMNKNITAVSRIDLAQVIASALLDPNACNLILYMTKAQAGQRRILDGDIFEKFARLKENEQEQYQWLLYKLLVTVEDLIVSASKSSAERKDIAWDLAIILHAECFKRSLLGVRITRLKYIEGRVSERKYKY